MLSRFLMLLMLMHQKLHQECKGFFVTVFLLYVLSITEFVYSVSPTNFMLMFIVDSVEIYSLRTVSKSLAGKPEGWNSKSPKQV